MGVTEVVEFLVERLVEQMLGYPPRIVNVIAQKDDTAKMKLRARSNASERTSRGHDRNDLRVGHGARSQIRQQLVQQLGPDPQLLKLLL